MTIRFRSNLASGIFAVLLVSLLIGFTPQEHPGFPFTEENLLFPYPVAEKRLNANLQNITVAERLAL